LLRLSFSNFSFSLYICIISCSVVNDFCSITLIRLLQYEIYIVIQYIFVNNTVYIPLQFNAVKRQLSMQCYEPSTTAHVVGGGFRNYCTKSSFNYYVVWILPMFGQTDKRSSTVIVHVLDDSILNLYKQFGVVVTL
jgi:hypothetical protein